MLPLQTLDLCCQLEPALLQEDYNSWEQLYLARESRKVVGIHSWSDMPVPKEINAQICCHGGATSCQNPKDEGIYSAELLADINNFSMLSCVRLLSSWMTSRTWSVSPLIASYHWPSVLQVIPP